MFKVSNLPIAETFAQVLETMAFIVATPVEAPKKAPPDPMLVRIGYTNPAPGFFEMVASPEFAALLAANIRGSASVDADAVAHARDALSEVANVVCGGLLSEPGRSATHEVEMDLPSILRFDGRSEWDDFVSSEGATVFDADGHIVAVRVQGIA